MVLQTVPSQTFGFMVMGFVVIFCGLGSYLLSLWLRTRRLRLELEHLESSGDHR
jgi:CcmD family protein